MQTRRPHAALSVAGLVAAAVVTTLAVASTAVTGANASRAAASADRLAPTGGPGIHAAGAAAPDRGDVGGARLAATGIVVNYPSPRASRLPGVPASAYVIADANTGQVLAAKDPHGLFPPASTLKVLTAITMLPRLNPNATVVATKLAASVEPNVVGLIPGHGYKVADLFRALLLISANDAAVSLVQAAGSFDKGMALLNAEAHRLQAYDVVAKLPNGLPAAGQVVSAYDLALIARKALSMPAFMRYDSTLAAGFPISKREKVTLVNQNYLLTQYHGGIGGKIGWTIKAGATYIGLARRHGTTLIVTVLHATPLTEITTAEKLFDWGFAMAGQVRAVGRLVPPLPATHTRIATKPATHIALPNSVASAANGQSSGKLVTEAGVTAALCACAAGGLVWYRRRAPAGRHARPKP